MIALPALAQDNSDIITLNDATPAVDVVLTLPPDTTGTIALNMNLAAVTLKDSANVIVFSAADARLHALELNIAPNTGQHTLTVERLPGFSEAYVSIISLPELPLPGSAALVQTDLLTFNQEVSLPLDVTNPGNGIVVNIPANVTGMISATFPGANATTQLVDSQGVIVAQSYNGHVDGMNAVLDGGEYDFTVLANNLADRVIMGVRAVPADASVYTPIEVPANNTVVSGSGTDCTASVIVSSVNLRSGPGTGYSIIDYGYRDEVFPVGGVNPQNNWVVIGTEFGSAWLSDSVARLSGTCDSLTVFDIPLRDAQPAPVIIITPEPQVIVQSVPSSGSSANQSSGSQSRGDDDDDHEDDHDDDHDDD
jgi:hypothetical protein